MLYKVFDFADEGGRRGDGAAARGRGAISDRDAARGGLARGARLALHALSSVYRGSLDEIVGILHVRDLFGALHDRADRVRRARGSSSVRPTSSRRRRTSRRCSRSSGARSSTWRSSSTSTATMRGHRHARGSCSRRSWARSRTSSTSRTTSVERIDETTIRIDGTFPIDDFNEEFGTELAAGGLPHDGRASSSASSGARPRWRRGSERRAPARGRSRSRARGSCSSKSSSASTMARRPTSLRLRRFSASTEPPGISVSGIETSRCSGSRWSRPASRWRWRRWPSAGRSTRSGSNPSISGSSASRSFFHSSCSPCPPGTLADRFPGGASTRS